MRLLACLLVAVFALPAASQVPEAPPPNPAPALVARLGAEDAAERKEAYQKLRALRRAAVPALEDGARSTDAETAAACRELLGLVARSSMRLLDGKLPEDTPWWKARSARVTADFVDTPLSEIVESAKEDLGFAIRVTPPSSNLADRLVTAHFDAAPLEFLLGWLLLSSVDPGSTWPPRLGWNGKEAILACEQRPGSTRITVEYPLDEALKGVQPGDVRALAAFIENLGKTDGASATVEISETVLKVRASPFTQVEASRLIDEFRRAAAGLKRPGEELEEKAIAAGEKKISVRWQQTPLADALAELSEKTGVPWKVDRRASQWGGMDAWHISPQDEPARVVAKSIADRWSMARMEQRWGAWWIMVDQGAGNQELVVRPAGEFVRRMMMADRTWQPGGIESWLKGRKPDNSGRWNPSTSQTVVAWFPDSARVAISAPRAVVDSLDQLFAARIREGELRVARIEGRPPPQATVMSAEEMNRRMGDRLAKEKITKEIKSEGFRENEVFQEVFRYLHDALGVGSTSGSMTGGNPRNRPIRACRLKETSPRVLWQWLNDGSVPWFLCLYPERRTASWGIGMSSNWDTTPAAAAVNRSNLHPTLEKEYLAFLEARDPESKKAFAAEPAMPGAPVVGAVKLPRPDADLFFAAVGLDPASTAQSVEAAAAAPAWLDAAVAWPAADLTLEDSLFKLAELCDISFILDVEPGAGPTRKLGWKEASRTPRSILEEAVEAAGAAWTVRSEGVIWVTSRRSDSQAWVWLDGGVPLGAEEAAAAAAEFAKTGDTLLCFGPTGRFAAKCAPARAGGAQAAFDRARAAAREAAREEEEKLEEEVHAGREAPAGLAGAMALETVAAAGSPEASFSLARRIAAGGHFRTAYRRFSDLVASAPSPDLLARAQASAAAVAVRFGPSDPAMDAETIRLAQEALDSADLPPASQAEALEASAEAWRRAGEAGRALDCYRRIEQLGLDTEETRRWRSRLETLPAGR